MLVISVDLNMLYSLLRILDLILGRSWQGLVYYVGTISTILRGQCDTSIRYTIHIVTVRDQYISSLLYHQIHLIRCIFCCYTSFYKEYVILLCYICKSAKNFADLKNPNQFICYVFEHNSLLYTSTSTTSQKRRLPSHIKHLKTDTYRDHLIEVREIVNPI